MTKYFADMRHFKTQKIIAYSNKIICVLNITINIQKQFDNLTRTKRHLTMPNIAQFIIRNWISIVPHF